MIRTVLLLGDSVLRGWQDNAAGTVVLRTA
jgi:hypothetical protein